MGRLLDKVQSDLNSPRGFSTGGRLSNAVGAAFRQRTSLPELQQQAAELEQQVTDFGAPAIEEDKPGIFRRLVDVLSRPNFAAAGFTEELLNGRSVVSGVSRALSEIFSGVGPIQGQKRAFGEVLEGQGVGTKTLADAFPALEGTWIGAMGSRGAAGIALDIATDPLTYMTFGTSLGSRVVLESGKVRFLSKAGNKAMQGIRGELGTAGKIEKAFKEVGTFNNPGFQKAARVFKGEAEEVFEKRLAAGTLDPAAVLDPGGLKFFGKVLPGTSGLSPKLATMIRALPGGDFTIDSATKFSDGLRHTANGIFHPNNELGNLPENLRPLFISLKKDLQQSRSAQSQRLRGMLTGGMVDAEGVEKVGINLAKRYKAEVKKNPGFGELLYEIREGAGIRNGKKVEGVSSVGDLTDAQRQIYDEFVYLHEQMGRTMVEAGILDEAQFLKRSGNYFSRGYLNQAGDLDKFHGAGGLSKGREDALETAFTKERQFDTYADSVVESRKHRRELFRNSDVREYPELLPDYDLLKNYNRNIDRYSDSLARQAFREQAIDSFGRSVAELDVNGVYALEEAVTDTQKVLDKINDAFAKVPNPTTAQSRAAMAKMGSSGKAEYLRQLFRRSKSPEEAARAHNELWDEFGKLFHNRELISEGDIERTIQRLLPRDADYVKGTGSFYGNNPVMIPRMIDKELTAANSRLLNTPDYKSFGKLIRGFDWLNNKFKLGVYTLWPASAARDAYSNIFLSMLDIGVGALNPLSHIDTVAIMAGRNLDEVVKGTGGMTRGTLRQMGVDLGVNVPGEVFAELTGASGKKAATKAGTVIDKTLKGAARKRALIENEARMQLWLQNIRRGVDPRTAADHVNQFLFDYGAVSTVEREFFRRLIPFYTFTRKNVELQVKMLKRNPGMVVNQLKPFRGRKEENEQMVKFESEALKMRLDKDGRTVTMLTGIDLPLRNLDTIFAGSARSTARRLAGMITPLVKTTLLEFPAGKELFTDRDLTRTQSGFVGRGIEAINPPKAIKDWLGYKKETDDAGRPRYSFDGSRFNLLFRSWMFSRLVSTGDRGFREYAQDPTWARALLDFSTGLRVKDIDLDEQQRRRLQTRIRQLKQSKVRRGLSVEGKYQFEPKDIDKAVF